MKHLILMLAALLTVGFSAQAQKLNRKGLPMIKTIKEYWHSPDDGIPSTPAYSYYLLKQTDYIYDENDECKRMVVTNFAEDGTIEYVETIYRTDNQFAYDCDIRLDKYKQPDAYWLPHTWEFIGDGTGKIGVIRRGDRMEGNITIQSTVFLFDDRGLPKQYHYMQDYRHKTTDYDKKKGITGPYKFSDRWLDRNYMHDYDSWLKEFENCYTPETGGIRYADGRKIDWVKGEVYYRDGNLMVGTYGFGCKSQYYIGTADMDPDYDVTYKVKVKPQHNLTAIYPIEVPGYALPLEWTGWYSAHIPEQGYKDQFDYYIAAGYRIKGRLVRDKNGFIIKNIQTMNGQPREKIEIEYVKD